MAEESIEHKVLRVFLHMALEDLMRYVARRANVPKLEVEKLFAELVATARPSAEDASEKPIP